MRLQRRDGHNTPVLCSGTNNEYVSDGSGIYTVEHEGDALVLMAMHRPPPCDGKESALPGLFIPVDPLAPSMPGFSEGTGSNDRAPAEPVRSHDAEALSFFEPDYDTSHGEATPEDDISVLVGVQQQAIDADQVIDVVMPDPSAASSDTAFVDGTVADNDVVLEEVRADGRPRCQAITRIGAQCRLPSVGTGQFCGIHKS